MNRKFLLLVGILCAVFCAGCGKKETAVQPEIQEQAQETVKPVSRPAVNSKVVKPLSKKANLYNSAEDRELPLSSIAKLAELPTNIKTIINNQIKDSEVYCINLVDNKVVILKELIDEAEKFSRHDFEIVYVSIPDGKVTKELSFPQKMSNEENDRERWEYKTLDSGAVVPISHTSFNQDGSVDTTENWYYGDDDLKYKVTDGEGKTISIRKTTASDNENWRDEHIFYNADGETTLNVSTVYENNNLARFTYYNPESPKSGMMIVNEYTDGEKTKETVYSSDYKLQNTYTAAYKDGIRFQLKVLDSQNNEVKEFLAE